MARSELLENIKTKKTAIVGLGISNVPLAEFLSNISNALTLRDKKERNALDSRLSALESKGAVLKLGEGYLDGLCEDIIFRSPGIRPDIPEFAKAVSGGATLTSETELFFELCPADIVAITGSDGKTTTTTLTGLILNASLKTGGKTNTAYVGGNIGIPMIPLLEKLKAEDLAVCELSSFQLQTAKKSARVAVITNISPNHLNWHTDMDEYISAKTNVFARGGCEMLITNAENSICLDIAKNTDIKTVLFSSKKRPESDSFRKIWLDEGNIIYENENGGREVIIKESEIKLPGTHNRENYMCAIAATLACGLPINAVKQGAREVALTFGGVEHRLEFVREINGVSFYNSSIDSSPSRTAAALSTFKDKNSVLICGGSDKNIPFDTLAENLIRCAKGVVITGEAGPKIYAALTASPNFAGCKLKVIRESDFENAVKAAYSLAAEGDRVLLSPACASFDAFKNFEERGRRFKAIVNAL